jgi:hypothetical protein
MTTWQQHFYDDGGGGSTALLLKWPTATIHTISRGGVFFLDLSLGWHDLFLSMIPIRSLKERDKSARYCALALHFQEEFTSTRIHGHFEH